jgi:competence protein ComEA
MAELRPTQARRPTSSPIAALGALLGALAISSLARTRPEAPRAVRVEPPAPAIGPLDLNQATAVELERLPRIGPALAARIVADRAARGPFRTVEDLDRVPGVGPATIAALAGRVMVAPLP